MSREDRIAAALEALPASSRLVFEPVLRLLIHDLNGVLSAVTMEAFAVEQLVTKSLSQPARDRSPERQGQRTENLGDAVRNLRRAAEEGASYLARVEALTDELAGGK